MASTVLLELCNFSSLILNVIILKIQIIIIMAWVEKEVGGKGVNTSQRHSKQNKYHQISLRRYVGGFISAKPNHLGVGCRLKAVSRATLLSLPITAKYFRRRTITFGYAAERWFKPELVGADIPCWPNYYSLLCCHIRLSSDNRLESASVIRWLRWTLAGSVKLTIKECVMNRMIRKWLPNVCISLCDEGFLPVTSHFEHELMRGGLLLTGSGKTWLFSPVLLFGFNKSVTVETENCSY